MDLWERLSWNVTTAAVATFSSSASSQPRLTPWWFCCAGERRPLLPTLLHDLVLKKQPLLSFHPKICFIFWFATLFPSGGHREFRSAGG